MGKRLKISNESLIMRFFRHLVTKTADKNTVYNISKGRIAQKNMEQVRQKRRGICISIKDPFLKLENHGYWLKDEKNFKELIVKVKEFIFAVQ